MVSCAYRLPSFSSYCLLRRVLDYYYHIPSPVIFSFLYTYTSLVPRPRRNEATHVHDCVYTTSVSFVLNVIHCSIGRFLIHAVRLHHHHIKKQDAIGMTFRCKITGWIWSTIIPRSCHFRLPLVTDFPAADWCFDIKLPLTFSSDCIQSLVKHLLT